jgi:hypothetical protein
MISQIIFTYISKAIEISSENEPVGPVENKIKNQGQAQ